MSKVILVTGGSSGIGRSICEFLNNKNYKVYGTSRNPDNYPDVSFNLLQLDVTNSDSISSCLEALIHKEGRIDVLVNNAGIGITGPVEEIPDVEIKRNFDTNFFGPVNIIKAVMPIMRKQNSGLIINITSIAGYMGLPYRGIYSASKAALEILTEATRMEVKDFNIHLTNLAPGDYATNIASGRYHSPVNENSQYAAKYGAILQTINADVNKGNDPLEVAKAVFRIMQYRQPKGHYVVGAFMQKVSIFLKRILPHKAYERLIIRHYKL